MDLKLVGKVALVAAGSKGLGKASAQVLAQEGAHVVIFSRDAATVEAAAQDIDREAKQAGNGGSCVGLVADVTKVADLERAVAETVNRHGGLDILVTNAGGPRPGTFDELSDDDWERGFQLTVMSTVRLVRLALPYMRKRGGGRIVALTSSSTKVPIVNLMLSNSLRLAVVGLMKTLSNELGPDGILVNCVAPGRIGTERVGELDADRARRLGITQDQVKASYVQQIALGRYGDPLEFGRAVAFLASFANTYVTGTTFLVDGGYVKAI